METLIHVVTKKKKKKKKTIKPFTLPKLKLLSYSLSFDEERRSKFDHRASSRCIPENT